MSFLAGSCQPADPCVFRSRLTHPLSLFHLLSQSHEPEFDYLKSLEIEEKINRIKWCKRQNSAHFLLSTNGAS